VFERPRLISLLAGAGVVVSLLFTYLAVRDAELDVVWSALRSSNLWYLVPSFAALTLCVFLRALRWRFVFPSGSRPPLAAVANALLIGYLFNNVLPARAGEAARVVALHQRTGASRLQTVATVTVERVIDVLSLLVLLFVAAPFLPEVTWLRRAVLLAAVLAALLLPLVLLLALFGDRPVQFLLRPLARIPGLSRERTERAGTDLASGLAGLRDVRLALTAFGLTALSWLALAVSAWALFYAFDLRLGFGAGVLTIVATNLAQVLPSSPGALGLFEAATLAALGAYGVEESKALSYAVVLHALNFFPYIVVGYVVLHRHASSLRRHPADSPL